MSMWLGSILGVLGAILLSINIGISPYGYLLMFISAFILTLCFYSSKLYPMLFQQLLFLTINAIGIFSWVL